VHVAFLSVSDQLGGAEMALLQMLFGLRAHRPHWTYEVILPGAGPLLERAKGAGAAVTVVPFPPPLARIGEWTAVRNRWAPLATLSLGWRLGRAAAALPAYECRLREALKASHPAILHTNGLKAHIVGARVASRRVAVVWHMHDYVERRYLSRAALTRYAGVARAIIANSESVARDVSAALAPRSKVTVIYNAVDLERFAPSGPKADLDALAKLPPPPARTVRVGLVGTFSRWKGHEVFLRALASLPSTLAVRGYIVGAPLYDTIGSQYGLDELSAIARELGIIVGFTGFVESDAAMRALDVVVHASTAPEPFGMVIAEAMACGRALITSATGGAAELVTPGTDAVVHSAGDVDALAQAIAMLVSDATLRQQYGERARAAALRRFDSRRLAESVAGIYEGSAGERHVRKTA
jgi:glycosyltransferase involved in cell wall biosynthesis